MVIGYGYLWLHEHQPGHEDGNEDVSYQQGASPSLEAGRAGLGRRAAARDALWQGGGRHRFRAGMAGALALRADARRAARAACARRHIPQDITDRPWTERPLGTELG